jgi:chromosome segregation ATPase
MTDSIKATSYALAEAESAANSVAEQLAAAHRHADDLRSRKSQLEAERDSIASDHRAGREVDGGRLAILALDLTDLDALITAASNTVAELQAQADKARAAVDARRQALQFQSDLLLLDGLKGHASALSEKLYAAITEINAALARLGRGGRAEWFPDPRLALEIRRLDLNRTGAR